MFGGKGECPAALDDAGDDGDAVKMAFAIVQVQRHAGAEDVALALFFGRLPEWREDGVAQGMKPVGTGDFALAVTRQAVCDADVARHGEAVMLCLQMRTPLRHERFAPCSRQAVMPASFSASQAQSCPLSG